jgi:hypothetical protein
MSLLALIYALILTGVVLLVTGWAAGVLTELRGIRAELKRMNDRAFHGPPTQAYVGFSGPATWRPSSVMPSYMGPGYGSPFGSISPVMTHCQRTGTHAYANGVCVACGHPQPPS